jgi:hypothetical protein
VTRASIHEYAEALKKRYRRAGKEEQGRILDEFCRTTGYHRKSAVRLLGRGVGGRARPRGRPTTYRADVRAALRQLWEASDRLCSKRLVGFLPDLAAALERHGELRLDQGVRSQLSQLSAATIDRLLREVRPRGLRRPRLAGAEPTSLRAQIPVRTFGEWEGVSPGAVQADLVVHCGASAEGFFLATLDAVDVATGWTECVIVWGRGQDRVGAALHAVQSGLPFPLRDLHTDNGSEFLNSVVYPWCQRHAIRLTRGRPYRKNDQAYVEQKNWSVVRRLVGYDRFSSKAAFTAFERLYRLVRLWVNFFQPVRKLVSKERVGAKVVKRFDAARTPYQRVLAADVLTADQRGMLDATFQRQNPVQLRKQIDGALEALWALAERSGSPQAAVG